MGKIYKALEKSNKEKKKVKKNVVEPFKTQPNFRQQPIDIVDKKQDRFDSKTIDDSKLGSIHALLDGTAKLKSVEREETFHQETMQDRAKVLPDKGSSVRGKHDKIQLKSQTDGVNIENNKYEPQSEHAQNKYMLHNGTIAEFTDGEKQGLAAQKFDTIEGLKESDSKIQYFHYEGKPIKPDKTERSPLRQTSGESQRLHYSLVTLSKPRSFEAEQFKILRANLLFPKSGKPPRTILLTSCVPGEGKTFTAINLAVSLAQNLNSHVLLVDADIRKPDVHTRFGFTQNIAGLSDFLHHNRPISSLLLQTQLPNLTLLPGGKAVINPSELLSSEKMKELLTELTTRYSDRYVIIDAPPPKLASETCALARFVERIIPVVRSGSSNRRLVEEMINFLERDKIQGIVLNYYDVRRKKRYGYRKYHEYYSR